MRNIALLVVSVSLASCVADRGAREHSYSFSNGLHKIEIGRDMGGVRIDGRAVTVRDCSNEYEVCLTGTMSFGIPKTGCEPLFGADSAATKMEYAARDHHRGLQWMYRRDHPDCIYEFDFDRNLRAIYHDFGLDVLHRFVVRESGSIDELAEYRLAAIEPMPPQPCGGP